METALGRSVEQLKEEKTMLVEQTLMLKKALDEAT